MLGVDWVKATQLGMPDVRTTVVNLGPNQLGASRLWIPSTPLGLGLGYALKPNWMLDLRAGFGFSALATSGNEPNTTFVAWTFMPGLSWVARGGRAKPYLKFSPLLEFVQVKQGEARQRLFGGCFSAGGGVFLFTAEHVSADLGVFFEGRFPDLDKNAPHAKVQFADARTLVRFGLSMWR